MKPLIQFKISIVLNQLVLICRAEEKNALLAEYGQLKQTSTSLKGELDSALLQLQQLKQQQQKYDETLKSQEGEIQKLRASKVCTFNSFLIIYILNVSPFWFH